MLALARLQTLRPDLKRVGDRGRQARTQAMRGLVDFARIEDMVARIGGRIDHRRLNRVTPLAAPLLLKVGRVPVKGAAEERLLAEEARALMRQAGPAPGENP